MDYEFKQLTSSDARLLKDLLRVFGEAFAGLIAALKNVAKVRRAYVIYVQAKWNAWNHLRRPTLSGTSAHDP